MLGVLMVHREVFQPLSSINYDQIANELYNTETQKMPAHIKLPISKFAHIYKAKLDTPPSYTA